MDRLCKGNVNVLPRAGAQTPSPLRAALYIDKGCRGAGVVRWAQLLRDSPDVKVKFVDGADIRGGALDDRELLVMPGGWGGPQYEAMGDEGAGRLRAFVADGGLYFGTCCGLAIALNEDPGFAKRLKMLPLRRVPGQNRGQVFATVTFGKSGAEWLGIRAGDWTIRYSNGPVVEFTDPVPLCSELEVLATMNCELVQRGEVKTPMFGTPAAVRANYGKGRILAFNCHPEILPSTCEIVAGGLRALSGREIRLVPPPARMPGAERIGYYVGDGLIGSKQAVEGFFKLREDRAVDIRPVTREQLDEGMDGMFDRVVRPADVADASARPAAGICGPFPLLCTPYAADGSLDCAVLAREAKFVADCGVNGVIWPPADDALKLLSADEERRGLEAVADALDGRDVYFCPCCPGRDTADALRRIGGAGEIAARHPSLKTAMLVRLANDAKDDADHERHFEAVAASAKHPVVIQTYNGVSPVPKMALMAELAKRHPGVFGWFKVEGSEKCISALMAELVAAGPSVKTVFTGWGGRDWLYQYRQIGTRGVISQRPMYADLMVAIWRALEAGSPRADELFAKFIYLRNLDEVLPSAEMRGWNLYVLKRRGVFANMLSRVAQADGSWKLADVPLNAAQIAEIEARLRFAGIGLEEER